MNMSYAKGFVKRAMEEGLSEEQAVNLFKVAQDAPQPYMQPQPSYFPENGATQNVRAIGDTNPPINNQMGTIQPPKLTPFKAKMP